jgi:hypothetical protein
MSVLDRVPEKVLQPSRLEDYQRKMKVFSDELVYLHTNLSLLRQIADFDSSLFQAPVALFRYIRLNLMSQCVLIVTRLWGDKRKDVLTLDSFGAWLPSAVRCCYTDDVKDILKATHPSRRVEDLIDNLRTIRHADVAHLGRDVKLGLKTRPAPIKLDEIQEIATCLGGYYNCVNFGAEMMFVLAQLEAPGGKYHESQLGYVFDRIALGSKWFQIYRDHPKLWPEYKAKLSSEQLHALNAVAARQRQRTLV